VILPTDFLIASDQISGRRLGSHDEERGRAEHQRGGGPVDAVGGGFRAAGAQDIAPSASGIKETGIINYASCRCASSIRSAAIAIPIAMSRTALTASHATSWRAFAVRARDAESRRCRSRV
jgi:hypothetical protein